jgi:hypothetical protein
MSELPQEWMASTVELMIMGNPRNAHYAIADAHNAALAAERRTSEKIAENARNLHIENVRLAQQLADEREKVQELAAEREKIKRLTDAINKPHPSVYELRALL